MARIPITRAHWCENCESVIDSPRICPGCASSLSIVPLAPWLDARKMVNSKP